MKLPVPLVCAALCIFSYATAIPVSLNPASTQTDTAAQSFNRPHGTQAIVVNANGNTMDSLYGRTFGQYGSYRRHQSWQQAVARDKQRHSIIHSNLKDTFPWLFKNLKTPSMGFGLEGYWNSYAPLAPGGQPT